MFQNVYYHEKVQALELMLRDVFLLSQPVMRYDNIVQNIDEYLMLTDETILNLQNSTCSELKSTKDLIERIKSKSESDKYTLVKEWTVELPIK